MTRRTGRMKLQATCGLLALGLVLLVALSSGPSRVVASSGDIVPPEVHARVQSQGRARVIVQLRLPSSHVPEGHLGPGAIVRQRSDISSVQSQVITRLGTQDHRIAHRYATVPLLALDVGPGALAELEASPSQVVRVVEDTLSRPTLAQSVPLIQGDQAWASGFDGTGAVVAILDTGVDKTHGFLSGRVVEEACYSTTSVSNSSTTVCPNGQDEQLGPGAGVNCPISDCDHGTHVAGIAAGNGAGAGQPFSGVAKGAQIMAVQVFSRFDSSSICGGASFTPCVLSYTSDQIAGLERVYDLRAQYNFAAANLSLGGGLSSTNCDGDPQKPMIDNLRSVGIATVISAGNNGSTNSLSAPGCISTAVSVGSTTKSDAISWFSNMATFLSLLAPGSSINSSVPGGGFEVFNGTSMSAPHVTGAWAILKQAAPGASVTQILDALQSTGLPIADTRSGGSVTKPRIRLAQALAALTGPPPTEIIIDNAAVGVQDATRSFTGSWSTSAASNQFGATALHNSLGGALATYRWTPNIPAAGAWDVYVWWSAQAFQSTAAPITVVGADGSVTQTFNEKTGGGQWVLHGRYNFNSGTAGYVQTTNNGRGHIAADAVRFVQATSTPNPAPTLSTLSPSSATAGGPALTLTVTGGNFVAASVVRWENGARPTTFVSATQLQAAIPAGDIAAAGAAQVTVFTPAPGGGTSNALTFTINAPPPPPPPPTEIIIDNAAVGVQDATRSFTGSWSTSAASNQFGATALHNSLGAVLATYRWTPNIPTAGAWDVYVWWSAQVFQSTAAPIAVVSADGSNTRTFNEKTGGGQWVLHGRYTFSTGTAGYVQTTNNGSGHIAADAVRFVSVP